MKQLREHRFWVMWAAALLVVGWYWRTDPDGGAETVARLQWLSWLLVAAGPVYLVRRALMDGARGLEAYRQAMSNPVGAGLVFLGLCLLTGLLFLAFAGQARAESLPPRAATYLPALDAEIAGHWPEVPLRSALAAQVEQETCPSLRSAQCWNPHSELKTSREYGFGLGQITVTKSFDNFAEAHKLDQSLRDWRWEDRYDARRQLRVLVLMDRAGFRRLGNISAGVERLAMMFAAYNGGLGGVLADRRICAQVAGCNPSRWFDNVEQHSLKSKVAAKGYGQSFFAINRGYVRNVLLTRRQRYASFFGEA